MSKQDPKKSQTCVLGVNIDCDGCKTKVKKLLQKIDGVYSISIDVDKGKVTVTGNVDPAVLIRKLEKSGKHAELWSSQKGSNNNNKQFDLLNNQFKNLQMGNGNDKKPQQQKGFGGGGNQQIACQQLVQQMKGSKDMKVPFNMKDQKNVRFNLPNKDDDYGDFSEVDFDEDDDYDEDFDKYDDDFGYGGHKKQEVIPIMGNGNGSKKRKVVGKDKKGGDGGGGKAKKASGGIGIMSMIGKAIGGKSEGKHRMRGKQGGSKNKGGGRGGDGAKGGGGNHKAGRGKGNTDGNGGNKGGKGKNGGFPEFEVDRHHNGGGGGGGMGHYPVMAAQGLPAAPMMNMNGGVVGPLSGNPNQQQQFMAMAMMNQQRMRSGGGDQPAMFGRPPPPPGYGYAYAPPMPPPAYHDPVTNMFSDENASSCSIM